MATIGILALGGLWAGSGCPLGGAVHAGAAKLGLGAWAGQGSSLVAFRHSGVAIGPLDDSVVAAGRSLHGGSDPQ